MEGLSERAGERRTDVQPSRRDAHHQVERKPGGDLPPHRLHRGVELGPAHLADEVPGPAAVLPDQTTGFAYADLKDALPLVQELAALAGGTGATALPDVSALQTLTAYGSGSGGGVERFSVFLEIR